MTLRQKDGSGTHTHTRGDGANDSSRENHQESKKHPQDSTRQNLLIWRFPKIGVPPVLIHFSGIFHEINHPASYWGTPIPASTTRSYARHVTGLNIDKEQIRQERRFEWMLDIFRESQSTSTTLSEIFGSVYIVQISSIIYRTTV